MHWQEACNKSPIGEAFRMDFTHKYIRRNSGYAISINMTTNVITDALGVDIEGYLDWFPCDVNIKKLRLFMKKCSYCGEKKPTVDRNMFDGMCAECTDKALESEEVAKIAYENNEKLKQGYK